MRVLVRSVVCAGMLGLGVLSGWHVYWAGFAAGIASVPHQHTVMEDAEAIREERDRTFMAQGNPHTAALLSLAWVQDIRRKQMQAERTRYVQTAEVTMVAVSKTLDTGLWVLTIMDPTARATSFWTDGDWMNRPVPVRTISPY